MTALNTYNAVIATPAEALAFVRKHRLVLESGSSGPPSLASAIAGEPIHGSWWAHAQGRKIFALTRAMRDSPEVLVCRLIDGHITYVHRRVWPALVRVSERFPRARLAQIREVHTTSGRHLIEKTSFADWIPHGVAEQAAALDEKSALEQLGPWCTQDGPTRKSARGKGRAS